ncbi:MAG TPA: hypothetical protein VF117_10115 [Gammaproteobacteria bacterium]
MYRYTPPKSNVWGHSLGKMAPAHQKMLFDQFLESAVAEYSTTGGSLKLFTGAAPPSLPPDAQAMWGHTTYGDVERFEKLLGVASRNGSFDALTAQQCETALAELVQHDALARGSMFLQGIEISRWLVEGQPVNTKSRIHLYYGMDPRITTFLEFETLEQFEFIKRVLADLKFCKLNEKHLKSTKRKAKSP